MLQPKPGYATLRPRIFSRLLDDPGGPETLLPTLTVGELTALTDALYRNLDTPFPELGAQELYELAVEEAHRRSAPANSANRTIVYSGSRFWGESTTNMTAGTAPSAGTVLPAADTGCM